MRHCVMPPEYIHSSGAAGLAADLRQEKTEPEPGTPLPPCILQQMERGFSQPFDDVLLHHSALADALNVAMGSLAFTVGNHIFFRDGAYAPECPWGRHLLAHELAHVVQKRLGRGVRLPHIASLDWIAALEVEAHRGAMSVSRGDRFQCGLPDSEDRIAPWGCAGHFYIPYLIYLNAQASEKEAFKTALYCWLPDQVQELDAKHLFIDAELRAVAMRYALAAPGGYGVYVAPPAGTIQVAQDIATDKEYYEMIHRGIHCLNGGDSGKETALRAKVLQDPSMGFLLRGVAHHPFGDSFAHRNFDNPKVMYDVGVGHGTDLGHPDEPWHESRGQIFIEYVTELQDVACAWTRKDPIVPIACLLVALDPILHSSCRTPAHTLANLRRVQPTSSTSTRIGPYESVLPRMEKYYDVALKLNAGSPVGNERGCCEHIKRVAADLVGRPIKHPWYESIREPIPWSDYYREHKPLIDANVLPGKSQEETATRVLASIRAAAKGWSRLPR